MVAFYLRDYSPPWNGWNQGRPASFPQFAQLAWTRHFQNADSLYVLAHPGAVDTIPVIGGHLAIGHVFLSTSGDPPLAVAQTYMQLQIFMGNGFETVVVPDNLAFEDMSLSLHTLMNVGGQPVPGELWSGDLTLKFHAGRDEFKIVNNQIDWFTRGQTVWITDPDNGDAPLRPAFPDEAGTIPDLRQDADFLNVMYSFPSALEVLLNIPYVEDGNVEGIESHHSIDIHRSYEGGDLQFPAYFGRRFY